MTLLKQILFLSAFLSLTDAFAAEQDPLTWDLGVATGQYRDANNTSINYSEASLGVNYGILDYLAWRNAVFVRFPSGDKTSGGLDTSLRVHDSLDFSSNSGLMAFAGAGFRFATLDGNVPFTEAGVALKISGVSIGGGAKLFLESLAHSSIPTYVQYFLILSGSGSF